MNTNDELKMLQSLPLDVKIAKTKQRIREFVDFYGEDGVYISRSGGKDSDVLAHIIKQMYKNIVGVFINTGLELDSVRLHALEECEDIEKSELTFTQTLIEIGYPIISKEVSQTLEQAKKNAICGKYTYRIKKLNGTLVDKNGNKSMYNIPNYKFLLNAPFNISHRCCDIMKKKPAKNYEKKTGKHAFLGTMTEESLLRKQKWLQNGCNSFESKRPLSQPLSFWTEQDILHYIKKYNVKISEAYGNIVYVDDDGMEYENDIFENSMKLKTTGESRTGCSFCMFGIIHDTERFLRLKKVEPKKYDYIMRGGKFINVKIYDKNGIEISLKHCGEEQITKWLLDNFYNENYTHEQLWIPHKGLGYKFVIDWLNKNGNYNIKY